MIAPPTNGDTTPVTNPYVSPFHISTAPTYHIPLVFDMNMPVDQISITPYLGVCIPHIMKIY